MIQRIILTMALLMLVCGQSAFGQSPDAVHQKVTKAIEREAKATKKADDWSWNRTEMIEEIRDLKTRVTWLKYRKEKHRIYIEQVKQNIADLQLKKEEALKVREQLDPYLEEIVDELAAFVAEDMPYLVDERERRLSFLRDNVLNNYQLEMSEKLRQVIDALLIETKDGSRVMSMDTTLNLSGSDTQVSLLVVGRVAMYYLSLDGVHVGRWNVESRQWEDLPEEFIRPIRRLLEVADNKRTVEVIEIPLGAL